MQTSLCCCQRADKMTTSTSANGIVRTIRQQFSIGYNVTSTMELQLCAVDASERTPSMHLKWAHLHCRTFRINYYCFIGKFYPSSVSITMLLRRRYLTIRFIVSHSHTQTQTHSSDLPGKTGNAVPVMCYSVCMYAVCFSCIDICDVRKVDSFLLWYQSRWENFLLWIVMRYNLWHVTIASIGSGDWCKPHLNACILPNMWFPFDRMNYSQPVILNYWIEPFSSRKMNNHFKCRTNYAIIISNSSRLR